MSDPTPGDQPRKRIPPPPPLKRPTVGSKASGWPRTVSTMRSDLDLEDEKPSVPYQRSRLFQAVDNVKAAHETSRPNAIATLAYDALRAAVDVHGNASGFKVAGKDKHALSVEYAHAAMSDLVQADDLGTYDELHLVRNRVVEYPPIGNFLPPTKEEALRYLEAADRFVAAVETWWKSTQ